MAQGTSESSGSDGQRPFWEHMDEWLELVMSFNEKMYNMELGPADGKLYMQACDLLTTYAAQLERSMLDEDNEPSKDSDNGETKNKS